MTILEENAARAAVRTSERVEELVEAMKGMQKALEDIAAQLKRLADKQE